MNRLSVIGTERVLKLDDRCEVSNTPVGIVVAGPQGVVAIETDCNGCIRASDADILVGSSFGTWAGTNIFEHPGLARAIFSDVAELDGLLDQLSPYRGEIGLDVGCGFGRLLLPLVEAGFRIDGVDSSLPLLQDLRSRLPSRCACRIINAEIDVFSSLQTYDFAFAALNTLRYLKTGSALRAHFSCMERSLVPGAPYFICVTLSPNPQSRYSNKWCFNWDGVPYQVDWSFESYCYVRDQITDRVVIRRQQDGVVIHEEYQQQANLDLQRLLDLLGSEWTHEAVFDCNFRAAQSSKSLQGNYWLLFRLTA